MVCFCQYQTKNMQKIAIFKGRIVRLVRSQPFDVTLTNAYKMRPHFVP